jgi:hypothetical protein
MSARGFARLFALALMSTTVRAESVYVIEQLVVSIDSAPGGGGERAGQVKSGDKLELLERQNGEAHVRLANGTEGWIKASYLSVEQPLQHRLTERTAEVERLKQDVGRLTSELASARTASIPAPVPAPVNIPVKPAINPAPAVIEERPSLTAGATVRDASGFLSTPAMPEGLRWAWVLGASLCALVIGFALGWRSLDRRIRQKFGGLRVY